MKKKYKNEALMVCNQSAEGLHKLGIISDARMQEFDEMCLAEESITSNKLEKPVENEKNTFQEPVKQNKKSLHYVGIEMSGYKFNREEANERR